MLLLIILKADASAMLALNIHRNFDLKYSRSTMNNATIHYMWQEDGSRAQIQADMAQIADIRNFKKGTHGNKNQMQNRGVKFRSFRLILTILMFFFFFKEEVFHL